jgi:membrane-bound metal-dependent hydrolase YbcI (DUF457 family)
MTAPTHVAFAVACGMLGGTPVSALGLVAGGALFPDIDHPQSAMGRILFFLSIPLNRYVGHRRTFHGFFLWSLVAVAGIFWIPLFWIGLGALSHVFIDALNVSGVQALMPFSEKVCVLFDRKWRIVTGSRKELVLMVVFGMIAWSGAHISSMGGMRAVFAALTGSYAMAYQKYLDSDTHICYMEGKLRHRDGRTEKGRWQVIGKEGKGMSMGIALWDEERGQIIHLPEQAEFLRVRLRVSDEKWQTLAMNGWARTRRELFFYDGEKWKHGPAGAIVFGYIVAKELELDTNDRAVVRENVRDPAEDDGRGVAVADMLH